MSGRGRKRKAEELKGEKESSSSSSSTSKRARTEKKQEERKDTSNSSMIVDDEPSEVSSSAAKSSSSYSMDDEKSKLVSLSSGKEQKGSGFPFGSSSPSGRKRKERDEHLSFPYSSSSSSSSEVPLSPLPNSKRIKLDTGELTLIEALGRYYTHPKFSNLKRLLYEDTFPIKESFINLALVKEEEQKTKEKELKETKGDSKNDEKSSHPIRDELLMSYETLHAPKEKIELSELFSPQKGESKEAPKRLLIEGRAGIGKTTLCQYLAYQWAVREKEPTNPLKGWPKPFSALIWLSLKRLNEYKDSDISLPRVVHRECLLEEDQERFSVEEIGIYLKQLEDSHEVLYLLDGYDELDVKETKEGKAYLSLLSSLWNKEWCIVTTRPYYVSNNTLWPREHYRRLENIGFVNENVEVYVERFFQGFREEKRGEAVLQSFERYPMIKGLGHVPILLELICSVWKDKSFGEGVSNTITLLYQEVIMCLLKRYLQREKVDTRPLAASKIMAHSFCESPLRFLEEIAWMMMKEKGLIIKPALFQLLIEKYCSDESRLSFFIESIFKRVGLLKGTGDPKSSLLDQDYYFIHLTFQEFFAARYLANSLREPLHSKRYREAIQFIRDNKYYPRYLIMMSFTAGLLSLSSKTKENESFIHRFWDTLTSEPYDLTGAGHLRLTMACLGEARCDERITQCRSLLKEIQGYLEAIINDNGWRVNFPGNLLLSYQTQVGVIQHSVIQEVLVNTLRSIRRIEKDKAIRILSVIGNSAATPEVLKGLLGCLSDKDEDVRSCAVSALGAMRSAAAMPEILKGLLGCLSDKDRDVRSCAISALEAMGSTVAMPEILKGLLGCLSDKDGNVRSRAVSVLKAMGSAAATPEVLKGLLGCLSDEDEDVRSRAVSVLKAMGSAAATPEVLKGLLGCLSDEDEDVRSRAASVLRVIGSMAATPEVLRGLLGCLSDKDWNVSSSVFYALRAMGSAAATPEILKNLLGCLSDKDKDVSFSAFYALRAMGSAAATSEILKGLLGCLSDKDGDVRSRAAYALGAMGSAAATPEILKGLLGGLNDEDENVSSRAASALEAMGSAAAMPEILEGLLGCLSDKDRDVRSRTAYALGAMGSAAATSEILKGLLGCLSDKDGDVRSCAVSALGAMRSAAATSEILKGLLGCLSDKDGDVRSCAVSALGAMGSAAATPEILRGLLGCLSDKDRNVRSRAFSALRAMGSATATPEVLKGLLGCLSNKDKDVRSRAFYFLEAMGSAAATPEILRGLLGCLSDKDGDVRFCAVYALGAMGSAAEMPEVLKGLLGCLSDKDKDVRSRAASALIAMGSAAETPEVLKGLLGCLSDKDKDVRSRTAYALGAMGSAAPTPEILRGLLGCLSDKDGNVRSCAVSALRAMGSAAATPEVLKGLLGCLSDEDRYVRSGAVSALKAMGSVAATPEVLKGLLVYLSDKDGDVRSSAVSALEAMGSAAATPEVLENLVVCLRERGSDYYITSLINQLPWSFSVLITLQASFVALLFNKKDMRGYITFSSIPLSQLIKVYFQTGYPEWAPIIAGKAIKKGVAVTFNQSGILIYEPKGYSSEPFPSGRKDTLLGPLIQAFRNQAKEVGLPVRVSQELVADSSLTLLSLGSFMSGVSSSSSNSEVKAGIHSVQVKDILILDFTTLQKTVGRIESEEVRKIITEILVHLQIQIKKFNADKEDGLGFEEHHFIDSLESLISYINNKQESINKEIEGDHHSKSLAFAILGKALEEVKRVYLLSTPSSSAKPQPTYWQENRLRLEQQLLLGESKVAQAFRNALNKVKTKGERDYRLPNGVFICYAWPDDKDSQEEHLKWVQPFLVELRGHLRAAGIMAKLDIKDGPPGGNIYEYMKGAETSDYVLLIGTESLLKKHEKGVSAVCTELININHKRAKDRAAGKYRVLPLLISGDYGESFPIYYELYTTMHDWKGSHTYYHHFCWLIRALYGQESEKCFDNEWSDFLKMVQDGERAGIVEPLNQQAVLAKMEAEKLQKAIEGKQQELASRKVLGLSPGDSKSERSEGSSASGGSSPLPYLPSPYGSLSAAQLMARQRQHDLGYGVISEGRWAFGGEPSSSSTRGDEQRKDGDKFLERKRS